jgi:hypothetical protein
MYELRFLEACLTKRENVDTEKLYQEQQRIEKAFLQFIYDNHTFDKTRIYVRHQVQGLLRLLVLEREPVNEFQDLRKILEGLLSFMEQHAEPYWRARVSAAKTVCQI